MRFELTTLCLGSRCSTTELRPRDAPRNRSVDGAEGIRTPDLLNAIQALSQLSYSPTPGPRTATHPRPRPQGDQRDLNPRPPDPQSGALTN